MKKIRHSNRQPHLMRDRMISKKDVVKLTQKKYRREMGLCIIEGNKLVNEHRENAVAVFSSADLGKEYRQITSLETPEGILAVVKIKQPEGITYPFIVLDNVRDPGNVGTLIRTAAAFDFNTIFCINCADVWSQKVIRSAMGAQFKLNIYESDINGFVEMYNNNLDEAKLFIADMRVDKVETPHDNKFGLVLGNEGQGVSNELKSLEHKTISIPTSKNVESLNVAVAGGILMASLCKSTQNVIV